MALSREITLTIDNYNITLDKEIKIYEYDAINLCFTIQECGIVMRDGKAHNRVMPVVALKAYMLIETPEGTDSVEATNIVRNKIMFSLGNKYSRFVGTGKMQIILKDFDGCRITLPEFNYEVKQSINTGWDDGSFDVLITEKEDIVITDELGRPVETTKISEFDETNEITPQTYTVVINEDGNKKMKLDTMMESISEMIEFDVEEIDRRIDEMIEVYDNEEIEVEFPSLHNDVERIKGEINEINESLEHITFYKTPQMFGAKGDGQSHKIKDTLPNISLDEVKELNPNATLDDETDWFAIQKAIKSHKNVYIPNGTYKISKPIVIDRASVMLEFSPFACLQACNNTPSVLQVGTSDTPYQANNVFNVKILNPWLSGENKTNVGLEIKCCGEHSVIRNPRITSFDKGIRTSCFDCFQLNEIYEPLLVRNNIGLDDSKGGLQAVRIFGGRIENNDKYGIVSASPNTKYIGSVIEGNKKAEIKLVNTTNANGVVAPSKLNLTSTYIEHSIYEGNEGIILLDGKFLGGVNIVNSDIFSHGDEMIKHTGSSMLSCKIHIHGGMLSVPQLFNLPYMTSDSVINVNTDYIESGTTRPVLTGVTGNAKINYSSLGDLYNSNYLHTNGVFGKDGVNKPTAVVHTKKLYLEPLSSTGGEQRLITYSKQAPWLDDGVGILAGSIHIDLSQLLGYMRITTKSGEDNQSNWKIIFNPFAS